MTNEVIIEMNDITKSYNIGQENEIQILKGISLKVRKGEFLSIIGQSGSGKSTLMNMMGILDKPTSGTYLFEGKNTTTMTDMELINMRNQKIGYVFQNFNLIPQMSAKDNVEIPMMYAGMSRPERSKRSIELLKLVGMHERAEHMPNELSGGQKQRIAIARALGNNPSIIFADEPTGALDTKTGRMIMDLFHKLHEERGVTIVFITHLDSLAYETDRVLTISDGNIISEETGAELEKRKKKGNQNIVTVTTLLKTTDSVEKYVISDMGQSLSSKET